VTTGPVEGWAVTGLPSGTGARTAGRAAAGRAAAGRVLVGIDAGGSSTRARAVAAGHGQVIYEGAGGPGNPLAADEQTLRASYGAALAGCPSPTHVGACVAGTGSAAQRARIAGLLAGYFPGAMVRVVPDFVAAFLAAPRDTDVCVIAGTGSLACSKAPDGSYAVSGGRGWILGDHGSASRLGRAALEWFVGDPAAVPADFAAAVEEMFGSGDWRRIVSAVNCAASPAALLARAAPLLTAAAERGAKWSVERLEAEMTALASTAVRHIEQHISGPALVPTPEPEPVPVPVRVALAGGVWASPRAESTFCAAMERLSERQVIVRRSPGDPVEGAVRLAESMSQ
jgi:glucosamine kinase